MKILIISFFFPPRNVIGAHRPYSWAKYLSEQGHQVEVITVKDEMEKAQLDQSSILIHQIPLPPFYYFIRQIYQKYFKNESKQLVVEAKPNKQNLLKKWLKKLFNFLQSRGLSTSTRMPDLSDFWAFACQKWLKQNETQWDFVISTYGPYSSHLIGNYLKKKNRCRYWIADYRDMWVDSQFAPGFPLINIIESRLEKTFFKRADLSLTVSEPMTNFYQSKYPNSLVRTIENGFEPENLGELPTNRFFKETGNINLLYTGTIYPGMRDPLPLIIALENLANKKIVATEKIQLHFFGPNVEIIKPTILKFKVATQVHFYKSISRLESLRAQRDANILLFLESNDPKVIGVLTGKLFEYLFSKTPIWGVGIDESKESGKLILKARAGNVFGTDELKLEKALKDLIEGNQTKPDFDWDVIQSYTRDNLSKRLLRHMMEL